MNFNPQMVVFILLFLWMFILTILFARFYFYYIRLTKNGKKESITTLLDGVIKKEKDAQEYMQQIKNDYAKLEKDGLLHIQKVGLVRFNPFKDTGGDQSFILALVDAEDTGVVISSLHTRTGTRWYAKKIEKGKGVEYELSEEEQKALKGAKVSR